jgi:dsDNA-specific endonuclease/ATPase MutS2
VASRFRSGDFVQTPLGKGVVREARNNGRLIVEIGSRAVVIEERTVAPVAAPKPPAGKKKRVAPDSGAAPPRGDHSVAEIDLHGLTVDEALARAEQALNDALLAARTELRLIHGRSGGRIRAALHARLNNIGAVRAFRLDPRNPGVTIVSL